MSFDKFLGKERRRRYRGSRRFDRSCRNNGRCPHCTGNRTYQGDKEKNRINSLEMEDFSSEQPDHLDQSEWVEKCDEIRSQLKLRGWEGSSNDWSEKCDEIRVAPMSRGFKNKAKYNESN